MASSSTVTRRDTVAWLTLSDREAASVLPVRATARKWRKSFQSYTRPSPCGWLRGGYASVHNGPAITVFTPLPQARLSLSLQGRPSAARIEKGNDHDSQPRQRRRRRHPGDRFQLRFRDRRHARQRADRDGGGGLSPRPPAR